MGVIYDAGAFQVFARVTIRVHIAWTYVYRSSFNYEMIYSINKYVCHMCSIYEKLSSLVLQVLCMNIRLLFD